MNPLTNVRNVTKLNEQDLRNGCFDHNLTWHAQYKDSAYIFIGGLPYDLTEGDVLCVFSQYGEIVNINLVRDKKTGKFKGYGFLCYEDQRSTVLAVDNLNAIKLGGRTIRVDHVGEYRVPKGDEKDDNGRFKDKIETGCAPKTPSPEPRTPSPELSNADELLSVPTKKKKKKEKKKKKKKEKLADKDSDTEKRQHKKYIDTGDKKYNENISDTSRRETQTESQSYKRRGRSRSQGVERHKQDHSLSPLKRRKRSHSRSRSRERYRRR